MTQIRGYRPNPLEGVAGSGQVDNTTLGFYGVTPVVRTSVPQESIGEIAQWADGISQALHDLGIIDQS